MTIEDPVEYQMPGVSQIEVNFKSRPHVRPRAAHDPALRSRRPARRRDPRRGDRPDRDPGRDDGPSRPDDAPHAERGRVDRAPGGHGRRAEPARDLRQLHRRAAARPPALRRLPRVVPAERRASSRSSDSTEPSGDAVALPRRAAASTARAPAIRARRALRGDARAGSDPPADRGGSTDEIFAAAVEQGMTTLRQDGDAARRSPASRRSTRSAASPATGCVLRPQVESLIRARYCSDAGRSELASL